jgi:hypothetical protein
MEPAAPQTEELFQIPWHPAFVEALRLELERYEGALEIIPEFQLTTEPLRIDVVVIKKTEDIVIDKNFAAIFRSDNLVEYKRPSDYIGVEDYYKVYGYACLYAHLRKVPITGMTLTFVGSRYPRGLFGHLRDVRGYTVEESGSGIYSVRGDVMPIQVIDSRGLPEEENLWLRGLSDKLDISSGRRLAKEIERRGKGVEIKAYLYAMARANAAMVREVMNMGDGALAFERALEEVGLTAKWRAEGEARGRAEGEIRGRAEGEIRGRAQAEAQARRRFIELLKSGKSPEELLKMYETMNDEGPHS